MKKWYMTFVCFGLIALLTACQSKISREEAYDIALKDAAVSESDVTLTKETTEDDEYQFEFHTSTQSFEYEISKSGKIEERTVTNYQATEAEKKNTTNGDNTAHDNTNQSLTAENSDAIQGSTEQPTTPLTQEQALEKVYAHFQVTEDTEGCSGVRK